MSTYYVTFIQAEEIRIINYKREEMRIQFQQETGPPGRQPQDTRLGGGEAHEISLLFDHQECLRSEQGGSEQTVGLGSRCPRRLEPPRSRGRVCATPRSPGNDTGTDTRGLKGSETAHFAAHQPQGT